MRGSSAGRAAVKIERGVNMAATALRRLRAISTVRGSQTTYFRYLQSRLSLVGSLRIRPRLILDSSSRARVRCGVARRSRHAHGSAACASKAESIEFGNGGYCGNSFATTAAATYCAKLMTLWQVWSVMMVGESVMLSKTLDLSSSCYGGTSRAIHYTRR